MVILNQKITVTKWLTLILRLKSFLFKLFLLATVAQAREQIREIEELGLGIPAEQCSTQNYTSASKNGGDSSRQEDLEKVGASVVVAASWQNQAKEDCFAISKKLVEWKPCSIDIKWLCTTLFALGCFCHRFWKNETEPAGSTTNQTAQPATNTEPNVNGAVSAEAAGWLRMSVTKEEIKDLKRRVKKLESSRQKEKALHHRRQETGHGINEQGKFGDKKKKL